VIKRQTRGFQSTDAAPKRRMMDDLSEVTGSDPATNQLKYLDLERLKQPAQDKQKGHAKKQYGIRSAVSEPFPV
jgi:hypothetical protein